MQIGIKNILTLIKGDFPIVRFIDICISSQYLSGYSYYNFKRFLFNFVR